VCTLRNCNTWFPSLGGGVIFYKVQIAHRKTAYEVLFPRTTHASLIGLTHSWLHASSTGLTYPQLDLRILNRIYVSSIAHPPVIGFTHLCTPILFGFTHFCTPIRKGFTHLCTPTLNRIYASLHTHPLRIYASLHTHPLRIYASLHTHPS
jgi:hypothetical protein